MLKIADALGLKPYKLFFEEPEQKNIDRNKLFFELYLELKERINKDLHEVIMKYGKGEIK